MSPRDEQHVTQDDGAPVQEQEAVRALLGAYAAAVEDRGAFDERLAAVAERVRARVRRRRALKATVVGAVTCVAVGGFVAGAVAAAGAARPHAPVPAATDFSSPSQTDAPDAITAPFEDGFQPSYWPSDQPFAGAFRCGASMAALQAASSERYTARIGASFTVTTAPRTVGDRTVDAGATTIDTTYTRVGPRESVIWGHPEVVLTQGGRIVDFAERGWEEADDYQGQELARGATLTLPTFEWDTASYCRDQATDQIFHEPTDETPRHAAGTYLAYTVAWFAPADTTGALTFDYVVSDPVVVTVGADGELVSPVTG